MLQSTEQTKLKINLEVQDSEKIISSFSTEASYHSEEFTKTDLIGLIEATTAWLNLQKEALLESMGKRKELS